MKCSKIKMLGPLLFIHIKYFLHVFNTVIEFEHNFSKEYTTIKLENCKYQQKSGDGMKDSTYWKHIKCSEVEKILHQTLRDKIFLLYFRNIIITED